MNDRPYSQDFSGDSLTDQSFTAACDVNSIVRHYEQTGIDPFFDRKINQQFGDASTTSYEDAMRQVAEVNSAFAAMPAAERSRYANDPSRWLTAIETYKASLEASEEPSDPPAEPPAELAPQDSTDDKSGE